MGSTVILAGVDPVLLIDSQCHLAPHFKHTAGNGSLHDRSCRPVDGSYLYLKSLHPKCDLTNITLLSTHGCIEWRLIYKDGSSLSIGQASTISPPVVRTDPGIANQVISDELG